VTPAECGKGMNEEVKKEKEDEVRWRDGLTEGLGYWDSLIGRLVYCQRGREISTTAPS
jgi:hypothetical protein